VAKFEKFGLTPAPAACVGAPLVAECFANLECEVADTRLVNEYNLFVLEVLKAWADPAQENPKTIHNHGYGAFVVDGATSRQNACRYLAPVNKGLSRSLAIPPVVGGRTIKSRRHSPDGSYTQSAPSMVRFFW
jgi:hypothetical protein